MFWRVVVAVFLLSLAVRLAYWGVFPAEPLETDAIDYDTIGWNLAQGHGYTNPAGEPTAFRPPVYPLFLAGVYYIAGHNLDWVRWVQALLGAGICVLVCLTTRRLYDDRSAKLAGLLCALYPPLIIPTAAILTETLFMFWLGLAVYGVISTRGLGWRFASGLALGLALMTRSILIFFLPFLMGWFILVRERRALVSAAAVLSGVLLVALPWTIRNYSHFGAFVPLTTHGGLALFNCYVLPPQGFGYNAGGLAGEEYAQLTDEVSRNRYLNRKTLEFIQQNPLVVAKLTVLKALYLIYPFDGYWHAVSLGSKYNIFWGVLLAFSTLGVVASWRGAASGTQLVYLLLLSFIAAMLVFQAIPRFRLPMEPFLICFAAGGIRHAWQRKRLAAAILVGMNAALFLTFRYMELSPLFDYLKQWM
jgi:4-amino-4-deoxy-L-arabinose transferase-like glycosyltransferase